MLAGRDIMEAAFILLQDDDHIRWPLPELARWINEGVRALLLAKPSAHSGTRVLSLGEGTLQHIPTVAGQPTPLQLLDITRNLLDADEPRRGGRIVKATSQAALDAINPNWHDPRHERYRRDVRHFIFNEESPLDFYVYPGNDGTGVVEAVVSTLPAALAAEGDDGALESYAGDIGLPALYQPPLVDYVCYRAHSKDALTGNAALAQLHYQQFATAIGLKIQVEGATSPNARRAGP